MEKQVRRYTFKLYPNKAQESALERQTVLLARLWNAALEQRETQWAQQCIRAGRKERKGLSYFDQAKELKFIRADDPEYAAMASSSLELTLKALDLAFQAFFRRAKGGAGASSGYPQYKASKRDGQDWRSYHHATIWHRDGKGWKLERFGKNWKVYAKGIPGKIKARGQFPADDVELRDMQIIRRDDAWWMSVVVRIDARRSGGELPVEIDLDLIDQFAGVKNRDNGECVPGLSAESYFAQGRISPMSPGAGPTLADAGGGNGAERELHPSWRRLADAGGEQIDAVQSEGDRRYKKGSYRWRKEKKRIARLKAKEARRRKDSLHKWTTDLIRNARDVLVIKPDIKDGTKSARGDEKEWGAAVKTVATLNRAILDKAPAMAISMLEYKAAEAGVGITVLQASEHKISIGRDLQTATKLARVAKRKLKKENEYAAV